jgi:hypothetical protein
MRNAPALVKPIALARPGIRCQLDIGYDELDPLRAQLPEGCLCLRYGGGGAHEITPGAQDLHQGLTYAGTILNYEYGGRRGQQCAEQVDPPTDVQLPEHGAQMRFHCLFADAEPCGDLTVS